MGNKDDKPKLMSYELVNKMKNEKGIRFEIVSEDYAAFYLENILSIIICNLNLKYYI